MTPDLSAAFLRCKDFLTSPGFVDVENASPECVADLLLIAREWAQTHREDDGEAVTTGWLEDIGFEHKPRDGGCFGIITPNGDCLRMLTINSM
mgnify:CR=1 FL=1